MDMAGQRDMAGMFVAADASNVMHDYAAFSFAGMGLVTCGRNVRY